MCFNFLGGETLKKIHEDSGVTIEINRNVPDNMPFRAFSLQGLLFNIDLGYII